MERDIVQFVPLRRFHSRSGANFSLVKFMTLLLHILLLFLSTG